jgi:hypothetical protein
VNGLPKHSPAITGRGRAIAKHPIVYSPIVGNPGYFLASGGYFAEFSRKRLRKRQSHAAASAPFHHSLATTTTAVAFARKITREPAKLTRDDYSALVSEFKEQGALEVLLQSCNFAYMNHFTDGLRLPSEDEAIKIYHETYGKSFEELREAKN